MTSKDPSYARCPKEREPGALCKKGMSPCYGVGPGIPGCSSSEEDECLKRIKQLKAV